MYYNLKIDNTGNSMGTCIISIEYMYVYLLFTINASAISKVFHLLTGHYSNPTSSVPRLS